MLGWKEKRSLTYMVYKILLPYLYLIVTIKINVLDGRYKIKINTICIEIVIH